MAFIRHLLNDTISLEGVFRLNDSAIVKADGTEAFSGNQSMGNFRLTNVGTPLVGTDGTNKDYVDNFVLGLSWKTACRAATTANIALSGLLIIDGVTLVANDRVLVKNQTLPKDNGIYAASAGAWARSLDADTSAELESATVAIEEGIDNADTRWTQTNDNFVLGTDPVTWVFIGAGAGIVAATLVVSPIPNVGDYTDIQSALNALPAAGGLIFVREGTYNITTSILMPSKHVRIIGCGGAALFGGGGASTIIDIGANVIAAFTMPNPGGFNNLFEGFSLKASTPTAGQRGFEFIGLTQEVDSVFRNLSIIGIEKPFKNAGTGHFDPTCLDCRFDIPSTAASRLFDGGGSVGGTLSLLRCTQTGNAGVTGNNTNFKAVSSKFDGSNGFTLAFWRLIDCEITLTSSFMTVSQQGVMADCLVNLNGVSSVVLGGSSGRSVIVGNHFVTSGGVIQPIEISAAVQEVVVSGNEFQGASSFSLKTSGPDGVFTGNQNFKVDEAGGSANNRYTGNSLMTGSVLSTSAVVDGMLQGVFGGVTSGSFTVVMSRVSLLGLVAIGTIKNTGGTTMEVRETVTDLFGVTDSTTTTVLSGNDYMLDAQTNFTTARPPYVSYQVEVRNTTTPTTFVLRHVAHGVS